MSAGLERRLEAALRRLPRSSPGVEERARRAALAALPPAPRGGGRAWRIAVPIAAAAAALLAGGAALAATGGRLPGVAEHDAPAPTHAVVHHVRRPDPSPPRRALPARARGFAAFSDGRLWLTTRRGLAMDGVRFEGADVSPRALYVTVGIGRQLVTMAADGRRVAWSRPAGGRAVAISWAPFPITIAYISAGGRGAALHTVWGTGSHDTVLDRAVARVTPAWRPDSKALAYVGAGGGLALRDLVHQRSSPLALPRGCRQAVRALAWSPDGRRIAAVTAAGAVAVVRPQTAGAATCLRSPDGRRAVGLAWLSGRRLAVLRRGPHAVVDVVRIGRSGTQGHRLAELPGRAETLAVQPGGGRLAVAVRRAGRLVVELLPAGGGGFVTLLERRAGAGRTALFWR